MRRSALTLAVLVLGMGAAVPVQAQTPPAPAAAVAAPASLEEAIPVIDAAFDHWQANARAPGLVYGIVRNGEIIHLRATGVRAVDGAAVTPDTLFRIASMSKAFTALAILKLRDEGKLSLDALAETYVPELAAWTYPTADSPRIRVRDLLNHTAGFVTDDPWGDRQQVLTEAEFTQMLRDGVPFTRAPQTAFEYSNFGYALLGRIVTNVSGRPYNDYIEAEIMRPLGMTSSGYDVFAAPQERRALGYRWENDAWLREPDMRHGAFGSMGGVQTSAEDYARWIAFLLSAWPARDEPETGPVRRSTVREMAQGSNFVSPRGRTGPDGQPCAGAGAYGMGLQAIVDCELGVYLAHGGGYPGYGSFMILMPERGTGLFAFANRTYAGPSGPLMDAATTLVRSGEAPVRSAATSAVLAERYADVGRIWAAGDVTAAGDRLAMNFLMDRSADSWRAVLTQLKTDAGACVTDAPVTPTGALSGSFRWTCDKGQIDGRVLLAPTNPATIQAVNFRLSPTPAPAPQ
ncbi:serine hydrolase domain-containing protein [Brevundimonas sp.]|uniref:serine hydrolase domain-containing protein n=1 Tax=Brevundimonas sp. TaxID=1871086 RepID=UPI002D4D3B26|nr:serine hydrolase domain-containing protein [Brevundimonas sp.]HYC97347.1 serine hydrolase domain-containing protein [Brevundimonas sp.]